MQMNELLPCPFCGGEAHTYKNNLWHVACERAHNGCVTMSAFVTEAEAIAAWNTRAPIEYEGWFYLPKPRDGIIDYGELEITRTENGCKIKQPVEVIESAIRSWGDELGEYAMKRICEAWNDRAERTCECVAEYAKSPIDGKTIVLHRCSTCHNLMRPTMPYCPNCGAKVVGE